MAVIVSDATPLNHLVEIGVANVLPQLYGKVIIPPAVRAEPNHAKTPKALCVNGYPNRPLGLKWSHPPSFPPVLTELDAGDMGAITFALQRCADLFVAY